MFAFISIFIAVMTEALPWLIVFSGCVYIAVNLHYEELQRALDQRPTYYDLDWLVPEEPIDLDLLWIA